MTEPGALTRVVTDAGAVAVAAAADARHTEAGAMECSTMWMSSFVAESGAVAGAVAAAGADAVADAAAAADAGAAPRADAVADAAAGAPAATESGTVAGADADAGAAAGAAPATAPVPVPVPVPLPALSSLPPATAAAIAAAAARAFHRGFSDEVEVIAAWDYASLRDSTGDTAGMLWAAQHFLGLTPHAWFDRRRVGARLYDLPQLAEAFQAGDIPYGKVRALSRHATPETEGAWLAISRLVDTETLETFVAATPRGALPTPVPAGMSPLRPLGGEITVQVRLRLTGEDAVAFRTVRGELDRVAGVPLNTESALIALAGWYLRLAEGRKRDTVIYQRSPETRGAAHPRDVMATALRVPGLEPGGRLRLAFARLGDIPAEPSARAPHAERRTRNAERNKRYIAAAIRWSVRLRDGDRCIVPGCGHDLVVQHDHGTPVAEGGVADIARDHRLCGPCNRARHLGLIRLVFGPHGTVQVLDRLGRPFGSVRLGAEWDATVAAYLDRQVADEWWSSTSWEEHGQRLCTVQGLFAPDPPTLAEEAEATLREHDREIALKQSGVPRSECPPLASGPWSEARATREARDLAALLPGARAGSLESSPGPAPPWE